MARAFSMPMASAEEPIDPAPMPRPAAAAIGRRAFTALAWTALVGCETRETASASAPATATASATASASASATAPATASATASVSASASAPATASASAYVPPLFRAHPSLVSRLPRLPLALLPTPLERAARLGARLGGPEVFFKRDDLSGALYGGGKTRKLEFFLAEARATQAEEIVTFGGVGSNQAVATALLGASLGLRVTLLLAPQRPSAYVRKNLLAARRAGARIELAPDGVAKAEAQARREAARNPGRKVYLVPPGGSSPLGNLAFVSAALELAEQIGEGRAPVPDRIYMAMGTMGSAVGLAIGLEMAGLRSEVVAVRASSPETSSEARFFAMAKETVAFARSLDASFPDIKLGRARVRFSGAHLGRGYGAPTKEGLRAIEITEQTEGQTLEPVYTAKAMAALVADAPELRGRVVVFWNSHNARPLETAGVDPKSFPASLRHYLAAE